MTDKKEQQPPAATDDNEDTGTDVVTDISGDLPPMHDLVNATYQKEQKGTAQRIIDELKKSS